MNGVACTVSIDTEEDNWGSFAESGASSRNIQLLPELQDLMSRWGARPTYLVAYAPLTSGASVEVLGTLGESPNVEIGGHCHPWNTPPSTVSGVDHSMMCNLPESVNLAKVAAVSAKIESELGVRPRSFRAGRWALGVSVSRALASEGYLVDASVSPFIDWSASGGPDFTRAPNRPYRFDPAQPLTPHPSGSMVEIPTTIGYLGGHHRRRAALRSALERSTLRHVKAIGILNRLGSLSRRWLSPEASSARDMIRLTECCIRSGEPVLGVTFHSCALLPGATPFVRDADDRKRFLSAIDALLRFCSESGFVFRTLSEVGNAVLAEKAALAG